MQEAPKFTKVDEVPERHHTGGGGKHQFSWKGLEGALSTMPGQWVRIDEDMESNQTGAVVSLLRKRGMDAVSRNGSLYVRYPEED